MKLVIVESPTKTKSLSKYLGRDYEIMASMGHVRDLPSSKFGIEIVDLDDNRYEFKPDYTIMKGKNEQVRKLKNAAMRAEEVILASDPDREGEAIAWHVMNLLLGPKLKENKFKRISFHSITKEAILEALTEPRTIDMNMVDSQQARRFLDRLVGYKLSPILWKKVRRGLSAGRVQSVAVRLIVEKEREIEKFVPKEYWQIKVLVQTEKGENFWVELVKIKGKTAEIGNGELANKIKEDLESLPYVVSSIKKTLRKSAPNPPFKTSTLQQSAATLLGWSAKRTMNVAQKLYEQGSITYHRTDSFNLAPSAIDQIRNEVVSQFGSEYLNETVRVYKTGGKVVAQEAHEAVRPTNFATTPENFRSADQSSGDLHKLYALIWRRTMACQMKEALYDDTKVVVGVGSYDLTASGEIVKFDGWKKLFKKDKEAVVLPELMEGDKLEKKKLNLEQKFTTPPARFNDASLIKELEKRGIGRPSTYASIISTIQDRRYVEQKERKFYSTAIGMAVVDFLMEHFPKEMDYEFTARMESDLDRIASGKVDWQKTLGDFWGEFREKIAKVDKDAARVGVPIKSTGQKCPTCKEGEVVIRDGKFGKFYSCNRYPECKYTAPYIAYVDGVVCEKCGKRIVIKKTRSGKDFYGCEDYPKCTWASWHKPVQKNEEETEKEEDLE